MKRMIKRMAAVGAAMLLALAAGCGQQTVELDPTEALDQLKTEISFTDQMTDMDSAGACRFYDVDTDWVADAAAYIGSGATAESMAVFEAPPRSASLPKCTG